MTAQPFLPKARLSLALAVLAAAAALFLAAGARAADTVYWANYEGGSIGFANLTGGSGGLLDASPLSFEQPNGVAIDSATGRIYWISSKDEKIYYANLAGGGGGELSTAGTTPGFPVGLAIDTAAGRIYWTNSAENLISYANLDGSGGGELSTGSAVIDDPLGVAIDKQSGRIYWANGAGPVPISYMNLAGGGEGTLDATGATLEQEPNGPVIDKAAGRIYFASYESNTISYANLNGTGGGDLATTGATVDEPFGLALDPSTGMLYWGNEGGDKVSFANVNGSGGGDLDTSGASLENPALPTLLKAPSPLTPPASSGAAAPGSTLACAAASWAPDLIEDNLYRTPQSTSLQWLKDGAPLAGATAATVKAAAVGAYTCQSTAVNHAGSTSQTSAPVSIFALGKAKANPKKGTATLAVTLPSAGTLTLTGKQVVKRSLKRSAGGVGTVKLLVKAKGKAKKALAKKGKAKVGLSVAFAPASGTSGTQSKSVVLRSKPKGR